MARDRILGEFSGKVTQHEYASVTIGKPYTSVSLTDGKTWGGSLVICGAGAELSQVQTGETVHVFVTQPLDTAPDTAKDPCIKVPIGFPDKPTFMTAHGHVAVSAENQAELEVTVFTDGGKARMSRRSAVRMARAILNWDRTCGPQQPHASDTFENFVPVEKEAR